MLTLQYELIEGKEIASLKQGDLLFPVPFAELSLATANVLEDGGVEWEEGQNCIEWGGAGDSRVGVGKKHSVICGLEFGWGIVSNQSCDLDEAHDRKPDKPIQISRVFSVTSRTSKRTEKAEQRKKLIDERFENPGKSPNLFYLPPLAMENQRLEASVADLHASQSFHPDYLPLLRRIAKLRLSDEMLRAFQERFAYCFGRFGTSRELYYDNEILEISK